MITEKKILQKGISTEIDLLRNRINDLEKQLSDKNETILPPSNKKIDIFQTKLQSNIPLSRTLPAAFLFSFIAMLLMGFLHFILFIFTTNTPSIAVSLSSISICGLIAGALSFYFKTKNERLRETLNGELVNNDQTETSIAGAIKDFYEKVKKRSSQIWAKNKLLKKEVVRSKEAELNIKSFNQELLSNRKILEEKNEELEKVNFELKQSEENLRDLNSSKDKFFSILAHDLKNPFASIIGLAEFLNEEVDNLNPDEAKKLSRSISNSAKRVHRLLENLLKWSLIQTGRIKFDPTEFNIKTLIDETAELFVQTAESKNIDLKIEYGHTKLVVADFNMIETAIRNLISNAVKFTKAGGYVLIKTTQQKQFVRVDIIDNGIGIKESDLDKIFCIEEHTNIAGTGNEKGTGIGLVLSKEFVERNDGKIWFNSELGKGSEFNITIPIAKDSNSALFDEHELI
ncbi:MAG: HAMP domain-containing histidine kinase [Ignavibacteriae bacterium]|nr:sensor histidine kinase [Ignavibacteriota bacterium]NOG99813.1 HAMP domain-containing histidine kinase [Ignavibacteriota bacterium]